MPGILLEEDRSICDTDVPKSAIVLVSLANALTRRLSDSLPSRAFTD